MNWVDLLVILLAVLAAVSGARSGMVTALFSFLGVVVGAVVGLKVAPILLEQLENETARVALGVGIVILLVAFGETFGMWAGRELRDRITANPGLTGIDNVLGAVVQCAAVLVVAWLVALPFTSATALPGLSSAVTRSSVLRAVDSVMPDYVRDLPEELRKALGVSGLPNPLAPFSQTPLVPIEPPSGELAGSEVVRDAQQSVVKVRGRAASCGRGLEGTGFVVAPHRVMTNAHVVAGTDDVSIEIGRGRFDAEVVHYDPSTDLATLSVPDLTADTMPLAPTPVERGEDVIALGYPLDGPYTAAPGRIRQQITLRGPDIYDERTVSREVYTVRGTVQSGNSGGPLVDEAGNVVGVIFGAAVDDPETGFVLTAEEVSDEVAAASTLTQPVPTGSCTD